MWSQVEAFLARKPGPSDAMDLGPDARLYWSMGCVRLAVRWPRPLKLEGETLQRVRALAERHGLGVDLRSENRPEPSRSEGETGSGSGRFEEAVLHRGGTYVCKLTSERLLGVPERMGRGLFEELMRFLL